MPNMRKRSLTPGTRWSQTLSLILLLSLVGGMIVPRAADAFITREYTLQEVLDACTNIVKGKLISVDMKRQRAKVQVLENLKGKSQFKQIQINVAVGQRDFPQKLMAALKPNADILVFYARKGPKIESIAHTNGVWFQTFADVQPDLSRTWWNFTHIEIYMHRTYDGKTPGLERLVRDTLAGKPWPGAPEKAMRILVLTGNGAPPAPGDVPGAGKVTAEYLALRKMRKIGKITAVTQATWDRSLPQLEKAHVLWLGQREVGVNGRALLSDTVKRRIQDFVRRGGVVIVSGQDSDDGAPCDTGWMPEKLKGIELRSWNGIKITKQGGDLFSQPNAIRSGQLRLDDSWTDWNDKFRVYATSPSGKELVIASLQHGNGLYLITALYNNSAEDVKANAPLMENLLHVAAGWVQKHSRRSIGS